MATNPVDPIEEEAAAAFADPDVQASIDEFHAELAAGTLRTYSTREAIDRLGLDPDLLADAEE